MGLRALRYDLLRALYTTRSTVTHVTFDRVPVGRAGGLPDDYAHAIAAKPSIRCVDVGTSAFFDAAPFLRALSASYTITELRGAAFRGDDVLEFALFLQLRNRQLQAHDVPRDHMSAAQWAALVADTSTRVRAAVRGLPPPWGGACATPTPAAAAPFAVAVATAGGANTGASSTAAALSRAAFALRAAMLLPPAVVADGGTSEATAAAMTVLAAAAAAAAGAAGTSSGTSRTCTSRSSESELSAARWITTATAEVKARDAAAVLAAAKAAAAKREAAAAETVPQRHAREAAERAARIAHDKRWRPPTEPDRYTRLTALLQQVFGTGTGGVALLPTTLQRLVVRYDGAWPWAIVMCKPSAQDVYLLSDELETLDRFAYTHAPRAWQGIHHRASWCLPVCEPLLSLAVPRHVPHYAHLQAAPAAAADPPAVAAGRPRVLSCYNTPDHPWTLRDVLTDTERDHVLRAPFFGVAAAAGPPTAACFLDASPVVAVGLQDGALQVYSVSARLMAATASRDEVGGQGVWVGHVPDVHRAAIGSVLELEPRSAAMGNAFPLLATSSWDMSMAVHALDYDDDAFVGALKQPGGKHRARLETLRRYGDAAEYSAASQFEAGVYSMCRVGNDWLVGGSYDHALAFDIDTGACVANLKQPKMWAVNALCPIPARNLLALGSSDGKVRLYDTRTLGVRANGAGAAATGGGAATASQQPQFVLDVPSEHSATDGGVAKLVLLPDARLLVCTGSGLLRAFDLRAAASGGIPVCLPQVWRESVDPYRAPPSGVCCYVVHGP